MHDHPPDLSELSPEQWESLCDGCGLCCLIRLEDEVTGDFHYTNVACRLFDPDHCRCIDYPRRRLKVPSCIQLYPPDPDKIRLMPASCAYRLRAAGKPLPPWHHLQCGDRKAIHRQIATPKGKVLSEEHIHPSQLPEHIVDWFDAED